MAARPTGLAANRCWLWDSLDSASPVAILECCHQEAWGVLLCSERPVGVLEVPLEVLNTSNRLLQDLNSRCLSVESLGRGYCCEGIKFAAI